MPFNIPVPQEAATIIAAGTAMFFHFGCCLYRRKPCDPGKLIIFAVSAGAVVTGVYVFFDALNATFDPANKPANMQNSVWASIGGLAIALFTVAFMIEEIRTVLRKPVDPKPIPHPPEQ